MAILRRPHRAPLASVPRDESYAVDRDDLPPRSTVNGYFCRWGWDGTLEKIHHVLYVKCREQAEREASPTACVIDSQSVKRAEKGALASTHTALMPAS